MYEEEWEDTPMTGAELGRQLRAACESAEQRMRIQKCLDTLYALTAPGSQAEEHLLRALVAFEEK